MSPPSDQHPSGEPEPTLDEPLFVLDEPAPGWVSVSELQCALRELFVGAPKHRAAARALKQIAEVLEADYAVIHARFGVHPLSEEWVREGFQLREDLREQVNVAMLSTLEADEPRCLRLGLGDQEVSVTAAVLHDEGRELAGSIGLVFRDRGRGHAYEVLAQLEAVAGFLALLLSSAQQAPERRHALGSMDSDEVGNPARILLELVSELASRHSLDQIAVGIVDGARVRVSLLNSEMNLRGSNPGVRVVQAAMSECLDVGSVVRVSGADGEANFRLHREWLRERGLGVVASVPMLVEDEIVAVLSVGAASADDVTDDAVREIEARFSEYAVLLPTAQLASRSWRQHTVDVIRGTASRIAARRRVQIGVGLAMAAIAWLFFGSLDYRVTVPCTVTAAEPRIVSCPRDGVLSELYARPGDLVSQGQLLAELDSHEDQLALAELEAEILTIEAQIDVALGEHDSGRLRVLEAQRQGINARIDVVERRIDHARIRAPMDGVVLAAEQRQRLGARLAMGEGLFQVARYDSTRVEARVPEQHVLAARDSRTQRFVAASIPDQFHELEGFVIAPASEQRDGKNVFIGEAELTSTLDGLPPGVEGFVILDVGPRQASWVLGHRIVDWLKLNFWL